MIVLIDNYDSFSYNVYQLIGSVAPDIKVVRNDEYSVKEIEEMTGVSASTIYRRLRKQKTNNAAYLNKIDGSGK